MGPVEENKNSTTNTTNPPQHHKTEPNLLDHLKGAALSTSYVVNEAHSENALFQEALSLVKKDALRGDQGWSNQRSEARPRRIGKSPID